MQQDPSVKFWEGLCDLSDEVNSAILRIPEKEADVEGIREGLKAKFMEVFEK